MCIYSLILQCANKFWTNLKIKYYFSVSVFESHEIYKIYSYEIIYKNTQIHVSFCRTSRTAQEKFRIHFRRDQEKLKDDTFSVLFSYMVCHEMNKEEI